MLEQSIDHSYIITLTYRFFACDRLKNYKKNSLEGGGGDFNFFNFTASLENRSPAVLELETCGLVNRSYAY